MPSVLPEAARSSSRSESPRQNDSSHRAAEQALQNLERHILMDGFRIVFDLEKSRGSYIVDATTGQRIIDFYGFFGSVPVGLITRTSMSRR
jgi:L-lysine 6-transaminase